jgi:hypothetical protein
MPQRTFAQLASGAGSDSDDVDVRPEVLGDVADDSTSEDEDGTGGESDSDSDGESGED